MKKRNLEVAVISDIHLGNPMARAEELLVYLSSIRPNTLVLNGCIFTPGNDTHFNFPKTHVKVVKKILTMISEGTEVWYLTGGPDDLLKNPKGRALGGLRFKDRLILTLDDKTTCILHGDIFDVSPIWVRYLKGLGSTGFKILDLGRKLLHRPPSRKRETYPIGDPKIRQMNPRDLTFLSEFDRNALGMALHNGYDTMICGYSRQPRKAIFENKKGQCLYLNSGDWLTHLTALEYAFKRWRVYNFNLDKLTAFYGDEEVADMEVSALFQQIVEQSGDKKRSRTAS